MGVFSADELHQLKTRDPLEMKMRITKRLDDQIDNVTDGQLVRKLAVTAEWDGSSNQATVPNVAFPADIDPTDCVIQTSVRATAGGAEERYIASSYIDTGEIVTRCRSVVGSPAAVTEAVIDIVVVGAPA